MACNVCCVVLLYFAEHVQKRNILDSTSYENTPSKTLKLYEKFLLKGFNCLKTANSLQVEIVLLNSRFPAVPGTHFIDFERMKDLLEPGTNFMV